MQLIGIREIIGCSTRMQEM